ncbi:protein polyglycylase TTLL10 [Biomphalaria pfeifferi]|uniref:Protein polyglycylase TTLL10 n=1 Tax=Biomphalaria pfeifferi TaxID=112525 RepID=A0AAD8FIG4_BIOPF|nr:protein polyglycylase TTLL10 [Biomphalaria pfeifferi]
MLRAQTLDAFFSLLFLQNLLKQERRHTATSQGCNVNQERLDELRAQVIKRAKSYIGVPYGRKYWSPDSPEYKSPFFLDCCGLVRRVIRDLQNELGFRLGPGNQAYMYDTLPNTLCADQMKPGDLVFMTGIYINPKSKKQYHNMVHVEIWLGDGQKTIGSRWNSGKVDIFDSYKFQPKSFHSEEYIFKSVDTWLMGECRSFCPEHSWQRPVYNPSARSIFNIDDSTIDEKANDDDDDSETEACSDSPVPQLCLVTSSLVEQETVATSENANVCAMVSRPVNPIPGLTTPTPILGSDSDYCLRMPTGHEKNSQGVNLLKEEIQVSERLEGRPKLNATFVLSQCKCQDDVILSLKCEDGLSSGIQESVLDKSVTCLEDSVYTSKGLQYPSVPSCLDEDSVITSQGLQHSSVSSCSDDDSVITSKGLQRPSVSSCSDEGTNLNCLAAQSTLPPGYIASQHKNDIPGLVDSPRNIDALGHLGSLLSNDVSGHLGPPFNNNVSGHLISPLNIEMAKSPDNIESQSKVGAPCDTNIKAPQDAGHCPNLEVPDTMRSICIKEGDNGSPYNKSNPDHIESQCNVDDSCCIGISCSTETANMLVDRGPPDKMSIPSHLESLHVNITATHDGPGDLENLQSIEIVVDEFTEAAQRFDHATKESSCGKGFPLNNHLTFDPTLPETESKTEAIAESLNRNCVTSLEELPAILTSSHSIDAGGKVEKTKTSQCHETRELIGIKTSIEAPKEVDGCETNENQSSSSLENQGINNRDRADQMSSGLAYQQVDLVETENDKSSADLVCQAVEAENDTSSGLEYQLINPVENDTASGLVYQLIDPIQNDTASDLEYQLKDPNQNDTAPGLDYQLIDPVDNDTASDLKAPPIISIVKCDVGEESTRSPHHIGVLDTSETLSSQGSLLAFGESHACNNSKTFFIEQRPTENLNTAELNGDNYEVQSTMKSTQTNDVIKNRGSSRENLNFSFQCEISGLTKALPTNSVDLVTTKQIPFCTRYLQHHRGPPGLGRNVCSRFINHFISRLSGWLVMPDCAVRQTSPTDDMVNIVACPDLLCARKTLGSVDLNRSLLDRSGHRELKVTGRPVSPSPVTMGAVADRAMSTVALCKLYVTWFGHKMLCFVQMVVRKAWSSIYFWMLTCRIVVCRFGHDRKRNDNALVREMKAIEDNTFTVGLGRKKAVEKKLGGETIIEHHKPVAADRNLPSSVGCHHHRSGREGSEACGHSGSLPALSNANNNSSKVHEQGNIYQVDMMRMRLGGPTNGISNHVARVKDSLPPLFVSNRNTQSAKQLSSKKLIHLRNLPVLSNPSSARELLTSDEAESLSASRSEGQGPGNTNVLCASVHHHGYIPCVRTDLRDFPSSSRNDPSEAKNNDARKDSNGLTSGEERSLQKGVVQESSGLAKQPVLGVRHPCLIDHLSEVVIGGAAEYHYNELLKKVKPPSLLKDVVRGSRARTTHDATSCDNEEEEDSDSETDSETEDEDEENFDDEEEQDPSNSYLPPWILRTRQPGMCLEMYDNTDNLSSIETGEDIDDNEEGSKKSLSPTSISQSTPSINGTKISGKGTEIIHQSSAHVRKAAQGKGEGADGGESSSSSKGASESKKEKTSEQGEGAGDDSVGKGSDDSSGGGGKKGVKNNKAPSCTLPTNMQPTFYVSGGNNSILVEGPLLELGWKKTTDKHDERYRLKWVENRCRINYIAFREGEQLVNHIPNCKLLTNKLGLLCSLQEYERVTLLTKGRLPRLKMVDFVPETYKLDERTDREKFLNDYKDGETWICKPTSLNQGKGIFLLRSREEINQLLSEREAKSSWTRQVQMRIVQRYIHNPLLIDGRKFDIRAYMFIASTVPFLVLFHKGYVRLSCQKYSQDDPNLTTHLTNQFVQKKDPSYKDNKEDTAWTMDKLNEYVNENIAKERNIEKDWVFGGLTKQMQRITLHCFNSVKHKLQCKIGYFDLYGMDFMVDADLKVWLIEINANPALWTNCQALKEAIPCVVRDGLYLAIECFDKSRKGQSLLPLNSLGGYNVLYCGSSPFSGQRQARSVSPFKDSLDICRPTGTSPVPGQRKPSPPRSVAKGGNNNSPYNSTLNPKPEKKSSTLPTINIGANVSSVPARPGLVGGAYHSTSKKQQTPVRAKKMFTIGEVNSAIQTEWRERKRKSSPSLKKLLSYI